LDEQKIQKTPAFPTKFVFFPKAQHRLIIRTTLTALPSKAGLCCLSKPLDAIDKSCERGLQWGVR